MDAGVTLRRVRRGWLAALLSGAAIALVPGTAAAVGPSAAAVGPSAAAVGPSDGVAADVFRGGSEIDVFYRGADSGIWERSYSDAAGWGAPFELPGTAGLAGSSPAVDVFRGGTEVDVYYRRPDGGVGESFYSDAHGWSGALELPHTAGVAASAPAVDVFRGGSEIDVYYRTGDAGIGESVYSDAGGRSAPFELPGTGGSAAGAPGVDVFRSGTEVDVYYQAANSALLETFYSDAYGWLGPVDLGGAVAAPAPSAPAATTILPPPAGRHSRPRLRVKVTIRWTWNRRGTRMRSATVFRLPRHATLSVRCHARGCPRRVLRARRSGLARLWRRLERPLYRAGDRITITITEPGHVPERAALRIRAAAVPSVRML